MTHDSLRTEAMQLAANHGAEAAQLVIAACERPRQAMGRLASMWTEAVTQAAVDEAVIAAHWAHVAERSAITAGMR